MELTFDQTWENKRDGLDISLEILGFDSIPASKNMFIGSHPYDLIKEATDAFKELVDEFQWNPLTDSEWSDRWEKLTVENANSSTEICTLVVVGVELN